MALEDFFDQAVQTVLVDRNIEREAQGLIGQGGTQDFDGANIAPLVSVTSQWIKLRITDVMPYGMGQLRAPNASPPLFKPKPVLREERLKLAYLDEMEPIDNEEWMKLRSNDESIRRGARLSLVDRGTILQRRNDQLTDYLRWESFKGIVNAPYPDGGTLTVDYGFDPSHFPVAAISWSNLADADPVADLNAWAVIGADDAGAYFSRVHLNTTTWRSIQHNEQIKKYLSPLGRSLLIVRQSDIAELLDQDMTFVRVDSGYVPEGATNRRLTKYLPDYRVLLTTPYVLRGQRIADVADGQVTVSVPGSEEPAIRQGSQSEFLHNKFTKQVFYRRASARLPRIYMREAFGYATVG